MIITRVCDYLQGWRSINEMPCLADVREALRNVRVDDFLVNRDQIGDVSEKFKQSLAQRGWSVNVRPPRGGPSAVVDAVKGKVGIEFFTAVNTAVPHRAIFATLPALKYAELIDLAIVLVPVTRLGAKGSRATYDSTVKILKEVVPLRLPMPLVIAGYAQQPAQISMEHLTTELDYYLQSRFGLNLNEISYKGEHQSIEFKRELPEDNRAIAREVCALANEDGGGLLLIGVTDNGTIFGVEAIDAIMQRLQSVVRDRCLGRIAMKCVPITFAEEAAKAVLAVEIKMADARPAMTDDRVPIRAGTTVRNARPDEIQRMVIADLAAKSRSADSWERETGHH